MDTFYLQKRYDGYKFVDTFIHSDFEIVKTFEAETIQEARQMAIEWETPLYLLPYREYNKEK
jgi:hypothetical protein